MDVSKKAISHKDNRDTTTGFILFLDKMIEYSAIGIFILTVVALFLFLGADVVVRYLTTQSLGWPSEMPNLLFPWLVMGGIVAASSRGQHVAVNAIIKVLNPRVTRFLMLVMQIVVVAAFSYLSYISIDVVKIAGNQIFPISGISSSYAYIALVYGFGAIALTALTNILWFLVDASAFDQRVTQTEVTE